MNETFLVVPDRPRRRSRPRDPRPLDHRRANFEDHEFLNWLRSQIPRRDMRFRLGIPDPQNGCGEERAFVARHTESADFLVTGFVSLEAFLITGPVLLGPLLRQGSRKRQQKVVRLCNQVLSETRSQVTSTPQTDRSTWHLEEIGVPPEEDRSDLGKGIWIGMVDTGVDGAHAEFAGRSIPFAHVDVKGMSTIGGRPFDHDGHGTHMAALAVGKNCGVAPGAGLAMASCPLDRNTASPGEITSQLFAGVEFLLSVKRPDGKEGVDIINLSLGVEGYSSLLRPTIRQVRATGDVLVIAAVGNRGPGKHDSPADYGGVQSIGAIDSSNLLWENTCFARYGRHKRLVPQYVAPGVGVWSAQSGGDYNPRSGTSIASALASGVAAVQIARRIAAGSNVKKCSWSFSHERLRHQGEELRKILL